MDRGVAYKIGCGTGVCFIKLGMTHWCSFMVPETISKKLRPIIWSSCELHCWST